MAAQVVIARAVNNAEPNAILFIYILLFTKRNDPTATLKASTPTPRSQNERQTVEFLRLYVVLAVIGNVM